MIIIFFNNNVMVVTITIFFIGQITDDVIVKSYVCSIGFTVLAILQTIMTLHILFYYIYENMLVSFNSFPLFLPKFYGIYVSKISKMVITTDLSKKSVNRSILFMNRSRVYPGNSPGAY